MTQSRLNWNLWLPEKSANQFKYNQKFPKLERRWVSEFGCLAMTAHGYWSMCKKTCNTPFLTNYR